MAGVGLLENDAVTSPPATQGGSARSPVSMWRILTALALSLVGLGVSIYLTIDHFAKINPSCPAGGGFINCTKVTTSPQSYFPPMSGWPHLPVALLGLCFYVVMVVINLPMAWRTADRRVHIARLILVALGMCFVLYLVATELLVIGNICLWCTSVHIITFLIFGLVFTTTPVVLGWGSVDPDQGSNTLSDG